MPPPQRNSSTQPPRSRCRPMTPVAARRLGLGSRRCAADRGSLTYPWNEIGDFSAVVLRMVSMGELAGRSSLPGIGKMRFALGMRAAPASRGNSDAVVSTFPVCGVGTIEELVFGVGESPSALVVGFEVCLATICAATSGGRLEYPPLPAMSFGYSRGGRASTTIGEAMFVAVTYITVSSAVGMNDVEGRLSE